MVRMILDQQPQSSKLVREREKMNKVIAIAQGRVSIQKMREIKHF